MVTFTLDERSVTVYTFLLVLNKEREKLSQVTASLRISPSAFATEHVCQDPPHLPDLFSKGYQTYTEAKTPINNSYEIVLIARWFK